METIGERVRALREDAGMTRDELARAVGAPSKTSIQNIEESPKLRTSRYLRPIADFFGIRLAWLESGRGVRLANDSGVREARQSYVTRPDAGTMLVAVAAVVAQGPGMGVTISALIPAHMEAICDAYVMVSQGKQILPGQADEADIQESMRARLNGRGVVRSGRSRKEGLR